MTSVRTGLSALELDSDGVMVCLSDQPALTRDDFALLAGAFAAKAHPRVLVPTFDGVRGNPIVLARATLEDILARGGNFGCQQFVAKNADIVATFEMPNDHVLVDIDRPEDYAAYS
jgi:molybdenum cofactor cytidylyltransferase